MAYPLLRRALFRLEPEQAHALVMRGLVFAHHHPGALRLLRWTFAPSDPRLRVRCFGLDFANPLVLAAGFDKDGDASATWPALGFGSAELGTVTALAQPGNPRPRAFRIPEERAVINRMGFNNAGAQALAAQLREARSRAWWPDAPVGVNVGKSRAVEIADARDDYERSLRAVWEVADYLVLNVSSPNTPGLRVLQGGAHLDTLLGLVDTLRSSLGRKPVLLKIAPDLDEAGLDEIVAAVEAAGLDGLVATNTTVRRDMLRRDPGEAGGLSGAPLGPLALRVLAALRARTRLPLVASGGIETPDDVIARLEAGATLVQAYTGWIYRGPFMARHVGTGLLRWLERAGSRDLQAWLDARDIAHARDAAPAGSPGAPRGDQAR
jgi:dihydroorotate dehydrogenase